MTLTSQPYAQIYSYTEKLPKSCRQVKCKASKKGKVGQKVQAFHHRFKCTEDILNFSGKGQPDCLAELVNSVINGWWLGQKMIPFSKELGFLAQSKITSTVWSVWKRTTIHVYDFSCQRLFNTQFICGRTGKSYLGYKLILDNQKQIEKNNTWVLS